MADIKILDKPRMDQKTVHVNDLMTEEQKQNWIDEGDEGEVEDQVWPGLLPPVDHLLLGVRHQDRSLQHPHGWGFFYFHIRLLKAADCRNQGV